MDAIKMDSANNREVYAVNPNDADWTSGRFILAFGAYSALYLVIWANSFDDALDGAIDWIADHKPGLLCDDQVAEAYKDALAEGYSEDQAHEKAAMDCICAGNAGNYIPSWEWSVVAENPTRQQMLAILGRSAA